MSYDAAMPRARSIALVIDDAPDTLGLVSEALERSGMTVLVARTGREGIDLARRVRPDVILMDAIMPGIDGFETCRLLKAPPAPETAPVIFMTGLSEPEHILRGLRAGGVDYITKPVVVDELIARILTHVLNAQAIVSARCAIDSAGQSVLAFSPAGGLLWGSPKALSLLQEGGCAVWDGQASRAMAGWLLSLGAQPISAAPDHREGGLVFRYLGLTGSDLMIGIRRAVPGSQPRILVEELGLTDREAQVLVWLTRGKTNRDIADILGLSARTVNKHLEQIFQKMGVDNRTSAAVIADRILNNA